MPFKPVAFIHRFNLRPSDYFIKYLSLTDNHSFFYCNLSLFRLFLLADSFDYLSIPSLLLLSVKSAPGKRDKFERARFFGGRCPEKADKFFFLNDCTGHRNSPNTLVSQKSNSWRKFPRWSFPFQAGDVLLEPVNFYSR